VLPQKSFSRPIYSHRKGIPKATADFNENMPKMSTSAAFRNPFMWLLGALYHFMTALAAFGEIS
jgi:hypothetical protein